MKRRPIFLLLFALAAGLLAAQIVRGLLREDGGSARAETTTTQIAVASRDLPSGAILRAEDIKMVSWPAEALPNAALVSADLAIGQGLRLPLDANEPVLTTKLAGKGVGGLPSAIPEGMRAVSVRVDDVIAVAGFVLPGTRVDVLVTLPGTEGGASVTRSILQNVLVLAAGQSVLAEDQNKAQEASVITLLLEPGQTELLTLASNEGRIQLALRNTLDASVATTTGVSTSGLGGRSSAQPVASAVSLPAPRPVTAPRQAVRPTPRENTVEVFNGSTRTVESF